MVDQVHHIDLYSIGKYIWNKLRVTSDEVYSNLKLRIGNKKFTSVHVSVTNMAQNLAYYIMGQCNSWLDLIRYRRLKAEIVQWFEQLLINQKRSLCRDPVCTTVSRWLLKRISSQYWSDACSDRMRNLNVLSEICQ